MFVANRMGLKSTGGASSGNAEDLSQLIVQRKTVCVCVCVCAHAGKCQEK